MTWRRDSEGYHVFFNRDELKTRSEALPPSLQTSPAATHFLAPTDPDAGGTWLLTNEYGVTIALLNLWHQTPKLNQQPRSRGQLVLGLADLKQADDLKSKLVSLDALRPFTIVALDDKSCSVYEWDGEGLMNVDPEQPLTSSSFRFPEVSASRQQGYKEINPVCDDTHLEYHRGCRDAAPSAFSVRMCRDDAQTWSTSQISVKKTQVDWVYIQEFANFSSSPVYHEISLQLPMS